MDYFVRVAEIFREIGDLKKLLDIPKCKRLRNHSKFLQMIFIRKQPKRIIPQTKPMFIILMTFGV